MSSSVLALVETTWRSFSSTISRKEVTTAYQVQAATSRSMTQRNLERMISWCLRVILHHLSILWPLASQKENKLWLVVGNYQAQALTLMLKSLESHSFFHLSRPKASIPSVKPRIGGWPRPRRLQLHRLISMHHLITSIKTITPYTIKTNKLELVTIIWASLTSISKCRSRPQVQVPMVLSPTSVVSIKNERLRRFTWVQHERHLWLHSRNNYMKKNMKLKQSQSTNLI